MKSRQWIKLAAVAAIALLIPRSARSLRPKPDDVTPDNSNAKYLNDQLTQ